MALAIHGPKPGEVVMTEARAINKYTLVPIGIVVAAVLVTVAVTDYMWRDKTKLAVLQTKNTAIEDKFAAYKLANDKRMADFHDTLHAMDTNIRLIAQKLEVDIAQRNSNLVNQNSRP